MKLNLDCIRDILIVVEENTDMDHHVILTQEKYDLLTKYSDNEILYHVRQCDLSGLLYHAKQYSEGDYRIVDLSPEGHEFLANVRKETVWNDVKLVANKVGASSLKAVSQIAVKVISEIIKAQLGLRL